MPDRDGDGRPASLRARLHYVTPVGRRGWALLGFPAASAVFTLGVMAYLTGLFDPRSLSEFGDVAGEVGSVAAIGDVLERTVFFVLIAGYNCLPPLALAALIAQTSRHLASGMPVVALGCLVYTAATVWLLVDMVTDDSSTSALLLLFLPVLLGALLLPFAGATALVHRLLRSRNAT